MTVTALVSGGKDSVYATYLADTQGWPVDELLTLHPADPDSVMFHTPNLELVDLLATAWGKRHRAVHVPAATETSELETLSLALAGGPGPVVVGAIQSSFQWARVLGIGDAVGRRIYAPLWRKDPARVVREEIDAGLDIRLVHLAAEPLTAELLGRRLDPELVQELERRSRSVRTLNAAGEGGEYETLVVDAPFLHSRIVLDEAESIVTGSTARLRVRRAHLEPKAHGARRGGT